MSNPTWSEIGTGGLSGSALIHASGERIEALLTASSASGVLVRERSEELVRTVVELYGAGMQRLLDLLYDLGRLDDTVLEALADDQLVAGLLLVHGLHPYDVETRVARALDSVRPYLGSHGGDVELVEITADGVVRLRLMGSCDGCSSSAATLELAVDGAVRDAAPEIVEIQVLASADSAPAGLSAGSVIPVSSLRVRTAMSADGSAGWQTLADVDELVEGRADPRVLGGQAVVVCTVGTDLFAFRDGCPHCESSVGGATMQRRAGGAIGAAVLRCPGCGHHFDVRHAGIGIDDADETLYPLPLLVRDGEVRIAVPAIGLST
ncbi:NifU family protein [Jatrophihabitans sp. DSM 45814]